jgi:hypothetical protein
MFNVCLNIGYSVSNYNSIRTGVTLDFSNMGVNNLV